MLKNRVDKVAKSIVAIMLVLFSGVTSYAMDITLRADVTVNSTQITLGDVAILSPPQARLSKKRLARAPAPGKKMVIERAQIARQLEQNGIDAASLRWHGAAQVVVRRGARRFTAADVQHYIESYLRREQRRFPGISFKFIPQGRVKSFNLPSGSLQVEVIPALAGLLGSRRFTLICRVDGRVVRNLSVSGKLQAVADVVTARHNLRRGQIVSDADVAVTRLDISKLRDPLFSVDDVVGKRVARALRRGQVVQAKNLDIPPLIKKGNLVKIVASRGALLLTATGIARQDGRMGDVIKVTNASSHKTVLGKITGPDRVEVEF